MHMLAKLSRRVSLMQIMVELLPSCGCKRPRAQPLALNLSFSTSHSQPLTRNLFRSFNSLIDDRDVQPLVGRDYLSDCGSREVRHTPQTGVDSSRLAHGRTVKLARQRKQPPVLSASRLSLACVWLEFGLSLACVRPAFAFALRLPLRVLTCV